VPHDTRDQLVDFVRSWSDKTDIPVARFMPWIGISPSKYHDWIQRFGKVNEHNAWVPRDHWLTDQEIADSAIGYVTPNDRLLGNDAAIHAARDRKLAEARERRKQLRQTRREHQQATADPARPAIDFAAVRAAIPIAQVLALLGFVSHSDHAGQQRGTCLLHGSNAGTARCFSVNTNDHTFHCFKCGRSGNALDQRLNVPLPLLPSPTPANREEEAVATDSSTCTIP
jgi:hypothetical protein